jgi:hypothetical protein
MTGVAEAINYSGNKIASAIVTASNDLTLGIRAAAPKVGSNGLLSLGKSVESFGKSVVISGRLLVIAIVFGFLLIIYLKC